LGDWREGTRKGGRRITKAKRSQSERKRKEGKN
jgi:hypothetical protein